MAKSKFKDQLDPVLAGVLSRVDAPKKDRLKAREQLGAVIRKLFNPVAKKHGLIELELRDDQPEAFYWGPPGSKEGAFVVYVSKGRLGWVTPVASGRTPALLGKLLAYAATGSTDDPLEKMHELLREHGWVGSEIPHSFRNMWFWTLNGERKPIELITHRLAFSEDLIGSHWRWRIEKADFAPGGTCMELGKLARDRRRHTVASLERRLRQLDKKVRMPRRQRNGSTPAEEGRSASRAKELAEIALLEKMLEATIAPPAEIPTKLAFLKLDPQDPEVRRTLIGEYLNTLTPAQRQELTQRPDESGHRARLEAFIRSRVDAVNHALANPGKARLRR